MKPHLIGKMMLVRVTRPHYLIMVLCLILKPVFLGAETFEDRFRPFTLDYLYGLFDSQKEKQPELDNLFRVKKLYNVKPLFKKKVMSYSLFWKAPLGTMNQPIVNKDTIYARSSSIKQGRSFYAHYVQPLLHQLKTFKIHYPGWIARIYLAGDLEFLMQQFVDLDAEVFLMASDSIAAAPGSMWRFLVFDDPMVFAAQIRDADYSDNRFDGDYRHAPRIVSWFDSSNTRGFFRLRDVRHLSSIILPRTKRYSPIAAGGFGGKNVRWIDMEKAMKGFILHRMMHLDEPRHQEDLAFPDHPYGFGNRFPDYGFDERFLKHVLYFAAVGRDELTLISTDEPQRYLPETPLNECIALDLSYCKQKTFGPF